MHKELRRGSRLLIGLSLTFVFILMIGCKQGPAPPNTTTSTANLTKRPGKQVTFKVTTMFCNGCVMNVTGNFKKMKGVLTTKVTLKPPRAHIKYDPKVTNIPKLIATLKKGGYTATLLPPGTRKPTVIKASVASKATTARNTTPTPARSRQPPQKRANK